MAQFPELLQFRAPPGTATALQAAAEAEGKRPAMIVREAIMMRLGLQQIAAQAARQKVA